MAGPSKRLGKGKNRLKFEDVSPRAEKEEQEMLDKKMYGGKMKKKPVAMKAGGNLKMVEKNGEKVPFYAADGVGKMGYGGKAKKMRDGGECRGMGAATRGGNFMRDG